jgi:hypothetical protein
MFLPKLRENEMKTRLIFVASVVSIFAPRETKFKIKGTFGDYTGPSLHGGIDLHADGDAPIRPVRNGTIFSAIIYNSSDGTNATIFTDYLSGGAISYDYGHVNPTVPDPNNPIDWRFEIPGTPIDNLLYNGYFTSVTDFGPGYNYANHLHLNVIDQYDTKKDPLYRDNPTDFRLDLNQYNDQIKPTLVELIVAEYTSPYQINVLDFNHLPFNRDVDFIVYMHDTPSSPSVSWDEKVGVNWIEWQVTETPAEPSTWNLFVKFTEKLPTNIGEIEAIYALSNAVSPLSGRRIHTYDSGNDTDHIDKMWYIVTNGNNLIYSQIYSWRTPSGSQPIDRYVWIRARDSNGYTESNYVQIHIDGGGNGAVDDEDEMPKTYALMQNYPNPFNPETLIPYELPAESDLVISVHNALGQEIVQLWNHRQVAGRHEISWQGRDAFGNPVPSGVYFVRMKSQALDDGSSFAGSIRLVLTK